MTYLRYVIGSHILSNVYLVENVFISTIFIPNSKTTTSRNTPDHISMKVKMYSFLDKNINDKVYIHTMIPWHYNFNATLRNLKADILYANVI